MSKFKYVLAVFSLLLLFSCKSEYDQLVNRELNSGVKKDSLIFNMHLGQTKKDFYTLCWELNEKQIITQGSGNQYARYIEQADSILDVSKRKQMDFFGVFDEKDVMHGMEMIFSYLSWAPWNKEQQADALEVELKKQFMISYGGNDFLPIELKELNKTAYVKVDGNMQILLYTKSEKEVVVKMEDLNYKLKRK